MIRYLGSIVLLLTVVSSETIDNESIQRWSVIPKFRSIRATDTQGFSRADITTSLNNAKDVLNQPFNESEVVGYDVLTNELETWEAPEGLRNAFPYYHAGYDEEGRPLWIAELGHYNLRKLIEAGGDDFANMDKYCNQGAYRVIQSLKKYSTPEKNITEGVFIIDMEGLDFRQFASLPTVAYAIRLARVYRDLIINHIGVSIIINATYIAEALVNIWRPIIGRAAERIEIYGANKAKWLPVLRRYFGEDILPEWYGGSKNFKPLAIYG